MKLAFVAPSISIHVVKWLDWFAKRGYEVHLITPLYRRPARTYHPSIKIHILKNVLPIHWRGSQPLNILRWTDQIADILSKVQPDIIEGQFIGMTGYTAWLACSMLKHPPALVLQAWGSDILINSKRPWDRWMTSKALKRAGLVFCDSAAVQAGLEKLNTDMSKVRRINNGIDTKAFCPPPKGAKRDKIILYTRNLEPVYDTETAVRAIPLVLEQFPDAQFVFCGEGQLRLGLEKLALSLGIQENTTFAGRLPPAEVKEWLQKARIYISSSLSDSTSLSLMEAMSCGLPPVISDIPANREWVQHGLNGFLWQTGDSKALANCIIMLLRNPEQAEAFGKLNREIVVQEADYEYNMAKIEGYYKELVG